MRSFDRYIDDDDDDDVIIPDGGRVKVRLDMMDGVQRAVATDGLCLHDGMGTPAGHKRGYVFGGNAEQRQRDAYDDARRAAHNARSEYVRRLCDAWKTPHKDASKPDAAEQLLKRHLGSEPDDNAQARRDGAYRDYVNQLSTAWQRGRTDPREADVIKRQGERWRGGRGASRT
jgi:hypothetical protein